MSRMQMLQHRNSTKQSMFTLDKMASSTRSIDLQSILDIIQLDENEADIYAETFNQYHGERNEDDDSSNESEGGSIFP